MNVVLAVGAHPDDIELGCGATLAKHAAAGDEVHGIVLATLPADDLEDADARMDKARGQAQVAGMVLGLKDLLLCDGKDQRLDMASRLDLVRIIEKAIRECRPSIVYTHHGGDRNLDHVVTHDAVFTACRPVPGSYVKQLLTFEVQSSTEWGTGFAPNTFVDVSGELFAIKMRALACYTDEMPPFPHPRSREKLEALSEWRGGAVGVHRAEAFVLAREIR